MLDLSPEKLLVLLSVGLVVLGPHKLPEAARVVAHGVVKARRLATSLTGPIQASLAEPRRAVEETFAEARSAVADPFAEARSAVVNPFGPPQDPSVN